MLSVKHISMLAASLMLPKVNPLGGDQSRVAEAVRWLEAAGGPEAAFRPFSRSHLVRMPLDNIESRFEVCPRHSRQVK